MTRLPQFFTDHSEISQQAEALLDQYKIIYDLSVIEFPGEGFGDEEIQPPTIQSGDGWFQGLNGVKSYIELVCDLDKAL